MYEQLFQRQEEIFKMLAGQKRLEIVQLLTHGELSVSEMVRMLGISQSNVSQHLSLLRQAGVVTARRQGTSIHYSLSDQRIARACSLIRQFLIEREEIPADSEAVLRGGPYPVVQDPVCGMRIIITEAADSLRHEGANYYFCAGGCKSQFTKSPRKYLRQTANK